MKKNINFNFKITCFYKCLLSLILLTLTLNLVAQQRHISGRITNTKGEAIPFAHVVIKGQTIGSASDEEGKYEILTNGNVTLIFSSIGYMDQEISTQNKENIINVRLVEDKTMLDEVVVVGYSQIERKHLASSVASVDMDRLKTRPIFKLQEGFSGTVAGVTMMQTNNMPGSVPGDISIRGLSTLQNASPLVIVDGMEQSLTDIDPNQIKSVNVLLDAASASMYGSRGANGVIIIETERGTTGKFKVDVHSWVAISDPIDLPNFVNSADYMRLNNEAKTYQEQTLLYTAEDIRKAERGETPNTNWLNEVMERRAHAFNNSVSISGGGGVGTFNLMLGQVSERGLNEKEGTDKFSARFNTNVNINDKFILLADFYAHRLQVNRLLANDDGNGLYQVAWRMNPTQGVFYNDDPNRYILHNNLNPVASIQRGGSKNYLHDRSTINLRPKIYFSRSLFFEGNVSYMINKSANKWRRETFKFYDGNGKPVTTWAHDVGSSQEVSESQITARGLLNFEQNLRKEKDKIYLLAGTEIMNYVFTDYREISKASFFGKLNYSFDNRYLLEATVRTDGSSKFAPGHRWGVFPAGSIGWNIHNEQPLKSIFRPESFLNSFKVRASLGLIGNENVDPYLWQEIVNTWGWTMRVPNYEFTWEKQRQWNIGMDITLMKNRLDLTVNFYNKYSYDLIYSKFPVPPLTGSYYLESSMNIGEVENKGWEISLKWSDKIGDFSYSISTMLFDNRNKVLKAGHTNSDTLIFKDNSDKIWFKGVAIDNFYGYQSNGYFQTDEEVQNTKAKLPNTRRGDIKLIDQNGDGIINNYDKIILGDPFPHYNYSVNVDVQYKRWYMRVMGQGVGKRTGRLEGQEGYPVLVDGNTNSLGAPRVEYMNNRWTPETPNSRFPRVWTGNSSNSVLSDVWLSDAAFFRIKSIQIGYTFPKVGDHIRNLNVYFNAQDPFTFTKWEGLEPERNGGSGNYPRMAIYSLGLKVTLF